MQLYILQMSTCNIVRTPKLGGVRGWGLGDAGGGLRAMVTLPGRDRKKDMSRIGNSWWWITFLGFVRIS